MSLHMRDDEAEIARQVYEAIQLSSTESERSQQDADFRIGMSSLGWCSERVRRMIAGIPEPPTDKLKAFIGTAIGDHVEQACVRMWPYAILQPEVTAVLVGDGGTYTIGGHPDLVDPNGLVIDFKTSYLLNGVRRNGPDQQQVFQRNLYAVGAYEAGLFNSDVALDDVRVANVWIDRSGQEQAVHCHMDKFSYDVVEQAAFWLDDVVYAYKQGEEARKEPPRDMCAVVCGHFATCRALDTDVEGLIEDSGITTAVDMYREGIELEKQGKRLKDEAKVALSGVSGSTGQFTIRWVKVGPTHVEFDREGYERLDIREIK